MPRRPGRWRGPGTPPPGDYLDEMADAVREFASLRDEVLAMVAHDLAAGAVAASDVASTRELDALLRALVERDREGSARAPPPRAPATTRWPCSTAWPR